MSSREPMWYCHECHAEMRPLLVPDPICASCQSPFVEKMEDPNDDPRHFQHNIPGTLDADYTDAMDPLQRLQELLSGPLGASERRSPTTNSPPSSPRSPDRPSARSGLRFEVHTSGRTGNSSRSYTLGGSNALDRSPERQTQNVHPMSEFLRGLRDGTGGGQRGGGDIAGPLMAQYLMAILGHGPGMRGVDPFGELFNLGSAEGEGGRGRWGDYVFNQEALDQIISQLMENNNSRAPVAASDEIVDKLPREVLEENSPLLEKDCAVCKDQFSLQTEDPDEQVVVTLPCKHSFHQGCIVPWLKSSGTCPVCRYALTAQPAQPEHRGPGSPNPGNSRSSGSPSHGPSSPTRPRSPGSGGSNSTGFGFLDTLLGRGDSSSSRRTDNHSNSRSNRRHSTSDARNGHAPPGHWVD